ncbi:MAG: FliM/FliN family flagellar motor switch protein [Sphingomonadales bacterium]|nr:FliM/FliN family flagellar motor switch protein [Sphingomonadales bacterium]MDE2569047.1 FliM/FliN family flagellar motor switch protein [Sphingomonadales bacterium]
MKPERTFVAERPVAQHCAELLRAGPGPAELVAALDRAGTRLARLMPLALYPLLGAMAEVESAKTAEECYDDFAEFHPELAANSLLGFGPAAAPILLTFDAGAALSLVDRAFGGAGEPPASLPNAFAMSADLMIQRIETLVCDRFAAALGIDPQAMRALRRDGSLSELAPFAKGTRIATLRLSVTEEQRAPWGLTLAFPLATLAELFGHGERVPAPAPRAVALPTDTPFADLPLPLRAVLVDMALPLSKLGALEVGQVLSVSVARAVPLVAGGTTIARGAVGAEDDRVAIQITSIT